MFPSCACRFPSVVTRLSVSIVSVISAVVTLFSIIVLSLSEFVPYYMTVVMLVRFVFLISYVSGLEIGMLWCSMCSVGMWCSVSIGGIVKLVSIVSLIVQFLTVGTRLVGGTLMLSVLVSMVLTMFRSVSFVLMLRADVTSFSSSSLLMQTCVTSDRSVLT